MKKVVLGAITVIALLVVPAANAATTADYAAMVAGSTETETDTLAAPVAVATTGGERCYRGHNHSRTWSTFGVKLAEIWVYQDGWCGTSTRISRDFGWHFRTYAWGPYCITNESHTSGWDVYPTWRHGQIHASVGVSYPWGCGAIKSGAASLRIARDGYWDSRY